MVKKILLARPKTRAFFLYDCIKGKWVFLFPDSDLWGEMFNWTYNGTHEYVKLGNNFLSLYQFLKENNNNLLEDSLIVTSESFVYSDETNNPPMKTKVAEVFLKELQDAFNVNFIINCITESPQKERADCIGKNLDWWLDKKQDLLSLSIGSIDPMNTAKLKKSDSISLYKTEDLNASIKDIVHDEIIFNESFLRSTSPLMNSYIKASGSTPNVYDPTFFENFFYKEKSNQYLFNGFPNFYINQYKDAECFLRICSDQGYYYPKKDLEKKKESSPRILIFQSCTFSPSQTIPYFFNQISSLAASIEAVSILQKQFTCLTEDNQVTDFGGTSWPFGFSVQSDDLIGDPVWMEFIDSLDYLIFADTNGYLPTEEPGFQIGNLGKPSDVFAEKILSLDFLLNQKYPTQSASTKKRIQYPFENDDVIINYINSQYPDSLVTKSTVINWLQINAKNFEIWAIPPKLGAIYKRDRSKPHLEFMQIPREQEWYVQLSSKLPGADFCLFNLEEFPN